MLAARLLGGPGLELVAGVVAVASLAVVAGLWPSLLAAGLSAIAELGMFASPDLGLDYPRELLRLPVVLVAAALATNGGRVAAERIGAAWHARRRAR